MIDERADVFEGPSRCSFISDGGGSAGSGSGAPAPTGGGETGVVGLAGLAGLFGSGGGKMAARLAAQTQAKILAQQLQNALRERAEGVAAMNLGFRENPDAPYTIDQPVNVPRKLTDAVSAAQSLLSRHPNNPLAKEKLALAKHAVAHFLATHAGDSQIVSMLRNRSGLMTRFFPP